MSFKITECLAFSIPIDSINFTDAFSWFNFFYLYEMIVDNIFDTLNARKQWNECFIKSQKNLIGKKKCKNNERYSQHLNAMQKKTVILSHAQAINSF